MNNEVKSCQISTSLGPMHFDFLFLGFSSINFPSPHLSVDGFGDHQGPSQL